MFELIEKIFIALSFSGSLVSIVNDSNLTTCISFNNELFMTRSYLFNFTYFIYFYSLRWIQSWIVLLSTFYLLLSS